MKHAEVLTVGNSAQPPPTGTSDGSIDLGVGLKTNPLSTLPSPSSLSLPLSPRFRSRATVRRSVTLSLSSPLFLSFIPPRKLWSQSGPIVPLLFYSVSPPLPLSSIYRCAGRIALLLCFSSSLSPSLGGKVSRFFCASPSASLTASCHSCLATFLLISGREILKGLFFSLFLSFFKLGNLRPCLSGRRFLGRVGGKCRFSTMRYFEYLYGMYQCVGKVIDRV